jgi:hypothetical protein
MPINSVSEIKFGMMVDGKFTEIEPIPELPNDSSIDSNENLFFEGSSEIEIVGTYDKSIFPIRNHNNP